MLAEAIPEDMLIAFKSSNYRSWHIYESLKITFKGSEIAKNFWSCRSKWTSMEKDVNATLADCLKIVHLQNPRRKVTIHGSYRMLPLDVRKFWSETLRRVPICSWKVCMRYAPLTIFAYCKYTKYRIICNIVF